MKISVRRSFALGAFFSICAAAMVSLAMERATSARGASFRFFYFDGTGFKAGSGHGASTVAVKDGFLPVVREGGGEIPHNRLPRGTGALVVFCYRQVAGGKLHDASGYVPLPGSDISIMRENGEEKAESDAAGFLLRTLPPGVYTVKVAASARRVEVDKGKTTLVALRAGKRMGD